MCKAAVKLSSPTNQHLAFYGPDALPVARSNQQYHSISIEGKSKQVNSFHGLVFPKLTWGFPALYLTTECCWLPWMVAKPLISPLTPVLHCVAWISWQYMSMLFCFCQHCVCVVNQSISQSINHLLLTIQRTNVNVTQHNMSRTERPKSTNSCPEKK